MPTPVTVAGKVDMEQIAARKTPVHMDQHMNYLDESKYFFEYLTRKVKKTETVTNMKIEFMEMRPYPFVVTIDEANIVGDDVIHVDNPGYCHQDQLLYLPRTDEFVLVNETVGGTADAGEVAVLAHDGGSGGLVNATQVGDKVIICPEAHAEGEAIPPAYSRQPDFQDCYLMQHDRTRQNTDIQRRTAEYGPKQLMIDRKMAWIEFKRARNIMLYIGKNQRETTSASGVRRHTMRGLKEWIQTNRTDFGSVPGALTLSAIATMLEETKYHTASSETKVAICGSNAWASISNMPSDAIRTTVGETEWGKRLRNLITPHGNLLIGYDNMLTAVNGLADIMPIVDPAYLCRLQLAGEPDRMLLNIEDNSDVHNQKDLCTGTFGFKLPLEELAAWNYGINAS